MRRRNTPLHCTASAWLSRTKDDLVTEKPKKRGFLTTEQAAEELTVSAKQIRALLKTGELPAIQVGGRGMWRIGVNDLEDYLEHTDAPRSASLLARLWMTQCLTPTMRSNAFSFRLPRR